MSKMHYIYSTLSTDQNMVAWTVRDENRSIPAQKSICVINGKANVATKNFLTPKGAVTVVSEEALAALREINQFVQWERDGYITVETKSEDPDKVAENMMPKDKSAPLTKKDVEKTGAKVSDKKGK